MSQPALPDFPNPFRVETDCPLVAIRGARAGYLMVASRREVFRYQDIPQAVFEAARSWAETLEQLGACRVYWLVLSEVTPHYHIHVFPRWPQDGLKGIPLFEARDSAPQPYWTAPLEEALLRWQEKFGVFVPSGV